MTGRFRKSGRQVVPLAVASVRLILLLCCTMFPLTLVRKTASGDLRLEGLPVYIAGSVTTQADLPVSGEAVGESYIIGDSLLGTWTGKRWLVRESDTTGDCSGISTTSNAAAIDAETINQTLLQTGFNAIP